MKVFVNGATGVLGKAAVARLVADGHEVTGVARSEEKARLLWDLRVTPVVLDPFDRAALHAAVVGHEVVCNLATHIPKVSKGWRSSAWADNDRIRTELSASLVDAALETGAARYVQESITFPYPERGDEWIDETVPIEPTPYIRSVLDAEGAAARFTAGGGAGVVLRFAAFYGPDSHTTQDTVRAARRGLGALPGAPDAWASSIHTDDAGAAVAAAMRVPAGVYNVADDEPVTRAEYSRVIAEALGRRVRHVGGVVSRLGGSKTEAISRSQRISNRRLRDASGWSPMFPSVREGLPPVVAAIVGSTDA
jgi:nucleoside-diphosphate-sugar epimerase